MSKAERVELSSAWAPRSDMGLGTCPVIYGDHNRDHDDVIAVEVSGARVDRLPSEAYYCGNAPSLVVRVATLHGTDVEFRLQYR